MAENPQQIIRSWNLQSNFATGPVVVDKLVPPTYGRIRTPFVFTWRHQSISDTLDWDQKQFSIYLPESLRVVGSIYLRIELPPLASGTYKDYPGLYIIKSLRFMSAGQEVYTCDYADYMSDYCQSLTEEHLKNFRKTYLGHTQGAASLDERVVLLPILLPNSAYMSRNGYDNRGHGVMPMFLGANRLEIQVTLNSNEHASAKGSPAIDSISSKCSLMIHEVQMTNSKRKKYQDQRGKYSIISRRFTQLTSDWQHYANANDVARWTISQPQGVVTEVQFIAVAHEAADKDRSRRQYILPTSVKVIADGIVQKDLDTPEKVACELYVNGFVSPEDFPPPGRLCFAAHCAEGSTHMYTGGYTMSLSSNVAFEVTFAEACDFRIVAVQLQRVKISELGIMRAFLE